MTDHKATPEQWAQTEGKSPNSITGLRWSMACCIIELRARVEALEAAQPIDEEENDRRFHACMDLIRNATPEQIRAAAGLPERKTSKVYDINEPLQLTPEQAQQVRDLLAPNSKPAPDSSRIGSSLVVRVNDAVNSQVDFSDDALECSRVAIREVAAWLKEHGYAGWSVLQQEAER